MSRWKSCLYATTLFSAVVFIMAGPAHAGSGTITYNTEYISSFNTGLNFPEQIHINQDKVYVANRYYGNVSVFDKDGNLDSFFNINQAMGVAIALDGTILATGLFGNGVSLFDPITHNSLGQYGVFGNGNGEFNGPALMATDASGKIYVLDYFNHRLQVLNSDGSYSNQITGLITPTGIAISPDNKIYISTYSGNVGIYNSSLGFIENLTSLGSGNGEVTTPYGIATDAQGNVYVVDNGNNRVQVFDKNNNFLLSFDNSSSVIGQFNGPRGIDVDTNGRIYVGEADASRISILQLTSIEAFTIAPTGNQVAATPLSNVLLNGTGGNFIDNFIGYNRLEIGTGDWTFSGTHSFSDSVYLLGDILNNTVDGTLTNNGTITVGGNVIPGFPPFLGVNIRTTYAGTGTLNGALYSGGTVSPGSNIGIDIGTMTVNGDYIEVSDAIYRVDINAAGQSDLLSISGTATLDASNVLDIHAAAGSYAHNTSYVILEAAGGISGIFNPANITSNFAFLTPTLDYSNPNQVTLTMTNSNMVSIDFAPYALSSNQQSVGVALTAFSTSQFDGNTAVFNMVMGLSQSDASLLLSQIAPDEVAALPQVQRSMVSNMQQPLFQRLDSQSNRSDNAYALFSPVDLSGIHPDQIWVQAIGGISNQDSTSNGATGYRLGAVGTRVGADKAIDPHTLMGISAAYAHGTADYKNSNDKSETQYGHIDLYGRHAVTDTDLIIEGFAGAGGGRMDSSRFITAGGLGLMAQGNTNAYDVSGSLRVSNPIKVTLNDTIIPNITTAASWTRQNGFTETGAAPFNLKLNTMTATPVTVTPMINWQHIYKNTEEGFNLIPDLGIGAMWQLNELDNKVDVGFANAVGTPGFQVNGVKQAPLSLNMTASLTIQPFTDNSYVPQLQAQASGQFNSKTSAATAALTAKWVW